jgi:hypothetical protein
MTRRRPSAALVFAATALVVAVGGTALAAVGAIPSDGRFTACYQTSDNVLNRIVLLAEPGEQCPNSYARVTWPAQASGGGQGTAGPQGPPGPQGPAGPAGPAGPRGASGSSSGTTQLIATVVQRHVTLDTKGEATVRCPTGTRAVGGGGNVHTGGHEPIGSLPVVEKKAAVGWAFQVKSRQRYGFVAVDGGLKETYLAVGHRHKYSMPPLLYPLEPRGLAKDPAEVTVYAICARLLELNFAKKRPTGGKTRSGG